MATTVAKLPPAASAYLRAFDLAAVALWAGGRITVTRNPAGARAAWWCKFADADRLAEAARADGSDILGTARRLGIVATDHAAVLMRVARAHEKRIEAATAGAEATAY